MNKQRRRCMGCARTFSLDFDIRKHFEWVLTIPSELRIHAPVVVDENEDTAEAV